jgi:hypothetical protein
VIGDSEKAKKGSTLDLPRYEYRCIGASSLAGCQRESMAKRSLAWERVHRNHSDSLRTSGSLFQQVGCGFQPAAGRRRYGLRALN